MARLRYNLAANFAGQGINALAGVAFLPLYIHFLGIERFALVGLYTTLYSIAVLLDGGLSTTLNREMAVGGDISTRRARVRAMEAAYFAIAVIVGLVVWLASPLLAEMWLNTSEIEGDSVAETFSLMGLVLVCQLPVSLYNGGLLGLQRHVALNVANSAFALIRWGGAVAVLWIGPANLQTYFLWQAGASLLHALTLAIMLWRALGMSPQVAVQLAELRGIIRFSGGVWGVSLLGMLLLQMDKIVLGRLLPLETLGYYMLASLVAGMIARVSSPIFSSFFPRFSELVASGREAELCETYHFGVQTVAVLLMPAALAVTAFAPEILYIWTRDSALAADASGPLRLLVLGFLCNGVIVMPYAAQLAHGWTRLAFTANFCAVLVLIPGLILAAPRLGAEGAATVWLAVNLGVALALPVLTHRRILVGEIGRFYVRDILPPLAVSMLIVTVGRAIVDAELDLPAQLAMIGGSFLAATFAALLSAADLRQRVFAKWHTTG